jgi:hypothetical protein
MCVKLLVAYGQAAAADLSNFATGATTLMIAET